MTTEAEESFHYFGYGSNLCSVRIHLSNPSAVKVEIGRLVDYELHFGDFPASSSTKNNWTGGLASIREQPGGVVWGVIWTIKQADLPNLDRQEIGYFAKDVTVEKDEGIVVSCRTYQIYESVPAAPSPMYKKILVDGAVENSLPVDYISKLVAIVDNGDTKALTATIVAYDQAKNQLNRVNSEAIHQTEGYFLYFAYGSNINSHRFSIGCPSAMKVDIGHLKNFALEFGLKELTEEFKFVGATIKSCLRASTWGVVWRVDLKELSNLDRQERIKEKFYEPVDVSVDLQQSGKSVTCRTYRILPSYSPFPPSALYKSVIIKGAHEHKLPPDYIKTIESIQDGPDYTVGPMKNSYLEATKN